MIDVQNEPDHRGLPIDRVGVRNVSYPVFIAGDRANPGRSADATFSMSVALPAERRGVHMSRFIETIEEYAASISPASVRAMTESLRVRLSSSSSEVEVRFPYFVRRRAPVSGKESLTRHDAVFKGTSFGDSFGLIAGVDAHVHTLCPCSKAISEFGAHNQRAVVRIRVQPPNTDPPDLSDLINAAEHAASAPLYSLMKREDEKRVTEAAYERARFVEDVARDVALAMSRDARVAWYDVTVESMESIHNHDAFAHIAGGSLKWGSPDGGEENSG
ncbi:MAG: GTP cyclohydrolase FolE2 [Synergistaceae bacterium]|nr:GTP cyclohydrolase FolE2 [Synergistaceae bacterium]